jgi:hypothetical protein
MIRSWSTTGVARQNQTYSPDARARHRVPRDAHDAEDKAEGDAEDHREDRDSHRLPQGA